jgi:hypothetical protein
MSTTEKVIRKGHIPVQVPSPITEKVGNPVPQTKPITEPTPA